MQKTENLEIERQEKLKQWVSEQHKCEHCGKIMTKYYGSGHFCSRSCANSRKHSQKTKEKISKSINSKIIRRYCLDCGKQIRKTNKSGYCRKCYYKHRIISEETRQKLSENSIKHNCGGFNKKKCIDYNGKKLDSSYELLVAQSLDKNHINWIRQKSLKYIDSLGKIHNYTPDFYLPDFDIYLDPKNDFLINNINPHLGFKDTDKIKWVCIQNNAKIIILNKNQLDWNIIKTLI